jgi:hypothetical protein
MKIEHRVLLHKKQKGRFYICPFFMTTKKQFVHERHEKHENISLGDVRLLPLQAAVILVATVIPANAGIH